MNVQGNTIQSENNGLNFYARSAISFYETYFDGRYYRTDIKNQQDDIFFTDQELLGKLLLKEYRDSGKEINYIDITDRKSLGTPRFYYNLKTGAVNVPKYIYDDTNSKLSLIHELVHWKTIDYLLTNPEKCAELIKASDQIRKIN